MPHSLQFKFIRSKLSINTALHYSKLITVHIHKEFPFSFSFVYPYTPRMLNSSPKLTRSSSRTHTLGDDAPTFKLYCHSFVNRVDFRWHRSNYVKEAKHSNCRGKAREKSASPLSLPSPLIINGQNFDDCLRIRHAIVRAAIISLRKKTSALLLVYYGF